MSKPDLTAFEEFVPEGRSGRAVQRGIRIISAGKTALALSFGKLYEWLLPDDGSVGLSYTPTQIAVASGSTYHVTAASNSTNARISCTAFCRALDLRKGDLLEVVHAEPDLIVCNRPVRDDAEREQVRADD